MLQVSDIYSMGGWKLALAALLFYTYVELGFSVD